MESEILKKLQQTELSILIDFDEFCKENNLQYYLIGGALLGAARYKGFIPWDDDIDVAMPRQDYQRLQEIWKEKPISKYFLQSAKSDPNFARCIMKLRANGTKIVELTCQNIKMHNGIYIDIFPIDYVSTCSPVIIGNRAKKIRNLMSLRTIKSGYEGKHNVLKKAIQLAVFWLPADVIDKKIEKLCTLENEGNRKYAVLFLHNYSWQHQIHEAEVFGKDGICEFEGRKFSAPKDMHSFLTKVFGEHYMKEPEESKKVCPHKYLCVDFKEN